MSRAGSVDERFQSYNVEMVEVTGGRFWRPYKSAAPAPPVGQTRKGAAAPAGMDPRMYEYRPPIDLGNAHGPAAAEDRLLVNKLAEQIRTTIQSMIEGLLGQRRSPILPAFLG